VDTVEQFPLALCDARTVDTDNDVRPSDVVKQTYIGESYIAMFSPQHVWHYLSRMRFSEGWLFKLFDSEAGPAGVPNMALHTALDIGQVGAPRMSCEVRVLVQY